MNDDHVAASLRDVEPVDGASLGETRLHAAAPKRFRPQVSLLTMLLAMAAIAVWLACWKVSETIENLDRQLPGLRSVARELRVDDPLRFAVVAKVGQWYGENKCEVYVPMDQPYRLCLALDAIEKDGLADPVHFVPVPSGQHGIEIRYDTDGDESIVRVLVDDQTIIEESRPKDWEPRMGSRGGMPFGQTRQHPTDQPLVLFRRRFDVRSGPNKLREPTQPGAGILVWIEPEKANGETN